MVRIFSIFVVSVVLTAGCVTSTSGESSSGELYGGMLGLGGDDDVFWADWTSEDPANMALDSSLEPGIVFDVWRIDDPLFHDSVWEAVFQLVMMLESMDLPGASALESLQFLSQRLEPGLEDTNWEISFVSHNQGQAEGLVLRIVTSYGAGLWLEGRRSAGSSTGPDEWTLRAEPAARQAAGLTVWWTAVDGRWEARGAAGAGGESAEMELFGGVDWEPFLTVLENQLWDEVTAEKYLQPDFDRDDRTREVLGSGWPAALGASVEERGLTNFVNDSVFWPRSVGDAPEGF